MSEEQKKETVESMFSQFIKVYRKNKGLSEQLKKDLWAAFNAGIVCGWEICPNCKKVNNENV